ncbi:MAG: hypothetical protein KAI64_01125 [Thermoplasmata archaeon]|nr:hypothetical protein [Thermoplasmata archaeon]
MKKSKLKSKKRKSTKRKSSKRKKGKGAKGKGGKRKKGKPQKNIKMDEGLGTLTAFCTKCDAEVQWDSPKCLKCGAEFESDRIDKDVDESRSPKKKKDVLVESPEDLESISQCPECIADVSLVCAKCPYCGYEFVSEGVREDANASKCQEEEEKVSSDKLKGLDSTASCPDCDADVPLDLSQCPNCGCKFEPHDAVEEEERSVRIEHQDLKDMVAKTVAQGFGKGEKTEESEGSKEEVEDFVEEEPKEKVEKVVETEEIEEVLAKAKDEESQRDKEKEEVEEIEDVDEVLRKVKDNESEEEGKEEEKAKAVEEVEELFRKVKDEESEGLEEEKPVKEEEDKESINIVEYEKSEDIVGEEPKKEEENNESRDIVEDEHDEEEDIEHVSYECPKCGSGVNPDSPKCLSCGVLFNREVSEELEEGSEEIEEIKELEGILESQAKGEEEGSPQAEEDPDRPDFQEKEAGEVPFIAKAKPIHRPKNLKRDRALFFIGMAQVVVGGPVLAFGSILHYWYQVPIAGDAYGAFGPLNTFFFMLGLIVLLIGVIFLFMALQGGLVRTEKKDIQIRKSHHKNGRAKKVA